MQPLKVTFENEAGDKAIVDIKTEKTGPRDICVSVKVKFEPLISNNPVHPDDHYIDAAMKYVKQFTSELL